MAGPTVAMLPQALGQVVYPRMSEQYGQTGKIVDLIRMVATPIAITFGFTLLVVTVAWFAIPPAVSLILPKYVEGTQAAQWSVAAVLITALTPVNNVFNVVKKQGRYGIAMLVGIASYYGVLRWLIREEVHLDAFPQAMLAGRTAFVVVCYVLVAWMAWGERRVKNER
jgi:O-antigen/teichoic acid export membrane protein